MNNETKERRIAEILDNFNFSHVKLVMDKLGMKWASKNDVPTTLEMESLCYSLLSKVIDNPDVWISSTGGFNVSRHEGGVLRLSFDIEESLEDFSYFQDEEERMKEKIDRCFLEV